MSQFDHQEYRYLVLGNIFKSFEFTGGNEKKFDKVVEKFDSHFIPKRNIIHERAKFHLRNQHSGESVESFIRNLYELAETCDFKTTKNGVRTWLQYFGIYYDQNYWKLTV